MANSPPGSARFRLDLGGGDALVLREAWTVEPLHALILKNLTRLRQWEPWAQGEQTRDGLAAFTKAQLHEWVDGTALPAAIVSGDESVGSIGARISPYTGTADVGYWIDASAEGHGLVTRAARSLMEHLELQHAIRRFEIRAAVDNVRSRAVAERLGFAQEGILRSALVIAGAEQDAVLYARLPGTERKK